MDEAIIRDAETASAGTGAGERETPDNTDGRRTRRVRGTKRARVNAGEGSGSGTVAENAVPGSTARDELSAKDVWGRIWHEFSERREKDRNGAYLSVIPDLANNADILVPELIQPKDFTDLLIHLEGFVKESSGAKEGSAIDHLSAFLNTGEVTKPTKKAPN